MPGEEPAESERTTDHDEIRDWVEERDGRPARVEGTDDDGDGLLRVDFGDGDDDLEPVSWDEFFEAFEENDLAMVSQDETTEGEGSRFSKLASRGEGNEGE
ncbi:hypothetical protein [Halorarum salinum]|uniref:1,4-alpha-glucan branching enzyme n=1 Tax=Halorarum salinum TaxID=2743089 RepID=A0A7D5QE33_9EURY|nr:hypothetical protein [Halobaculum salinum]QLG60422.1 hypothetical protein HUG12_01110 [Halobaculum salinum]